jgi:hypothetical protein
LAWQVAGQVARQALPQSAAAEQLFGASKAFKAPSASFGLCLSLSLRLRSSLLQGLFDFVIVRDFGGLWGWA